MSDVAALKDLQERVRNATGPDRELDADIIWHLVLTDQNRRVVDGVRYIRAGTHYLHGDVFEPYIANFEGYPVTASLDRARALLAKVLPGFWWTCGLCGLTGHASIGPDYNGPIGDHLRRKWPEERFHAGFDSDLAPGDGVHRTCLALLDTILAAKIAELELAQ